MKDNIDYLKLAAEIALCDMDKFAVAVGEVKDAAKKLVETGQPGSVSDVIPDGREEHPSINKFLKISDELQLVRFRGPNFVKLVGRVPARCGNPPQCYEIEVAKVKRPGASAIVKRNGHAIFQILGDVNSNLLEVMAVSALHRWWKNTRDGNRRSKESKKRAKAAKRAVIEEAQG